MCDSLRQACRSFPLIERIFGDADYQGPKAARVVADTGRRTFEIVKRTDVRRATSSATPAPPQPSCTRP